MNRLWLVLRVVAASVVFTMPVWAEAPFVGDAAQYQTFDPASEFIVDRKTELRWQRGRSATQVSFADAKCADGRLPSLKELLTILDEEPYPFYNGTGYENRYIDVRAFGTKGVGATSSERTPPGPFWTSSLVDNETVWTVDFKKGSVDATSKNGMAWVRCVDRN